MKIVEFNLKKEHILLLQRSNIGWDNSNFGAPCVNSKRPYGDSDVYKNIAEVMQIKPTMIDLDEPADYSLLQYEQMNRMHRELETALEIVLHTQSFVPGLYESYLYSNDWQIIE